MNEKKKLSDLYKRAKTVCFDDNSKIVIMSDCHRGDGSYADDFTHNQNICYVALNQYYNEGYTYIELGDGDELWENKEFINISRQHGIIFDILSKFYKADRLYMIYGNHDMVKKDEKWVEKKLLNCNNEFCDINNALFPGIEMHEALILTHKDTKDNIFLLHGHQVDFLNCELWCIARFLVRYLWRPLEIIGVNDPTDPSNNYKRKGKVEHHLINWSKAEKQMIVAGHTHRLAFPEVGEPMYFNDGSGIYPNYISAIEIDKGAISAVFWSVKTRPDSTLYISKKTVRGPIKISDYYRSSKIK